MKLRNLLEHPLTRGLDLDSPETTRLRSRIVHEKGFLRRIYEEWYSLLVEALPAGGGSVLELGSGGGFLGRRIPELLTSEVFPLPDVRLILDGHALPFRRDSLRAIVMTNVLHHLGRPAAFFAEAGRCVRPGGAIAMVEPWVSGWSRLVYGHLHHEPFDPEAPEWEFSGGGPLSAANSALPWIVFERDRPRFERDYPMWRIEVTRPIMPLRYLVSGGVSSRPMMPAWTTGPWRALERTWPIRRGAMFALIVLRRVAG